MRAIKEMANSNNRMLAVVKHRIGGKENVKGRFHGTFTYHGNESSVPPTDIALDFARSQIYMAGMPGPSYTWSGFSNSAKGSIAEIETDRIMSIVTERLDESLVVLSHYMNWTLADVVVTVHRKALSSHPHHTAWPPNVVKLLEKQLQAKGEYAVYAAASRKLDQRIMFLKNNGVDFDRELKIFQELKVRSTEVSVHHTLACEVDILF